MYLYRTDAVSVDGYWQIREKDDALLEYIDGLVYPALTGSKTPTSRF
ncbi:hypothetical protein WMZ97_10940 [Lentibacillus sp. N15]